MNANTLFSALAVAGFFLCGTGMAIAQDASQDGADLEAGEAADAAVEPAAIRNEDLRLTSVNGVDVWRLTCTSTPVAAVQSVRARVLDRGGADGRQIYLHITRQSTGRTEKTTAPDGTGRFSGFVGLTTGGAGSVHFVQVSKDRRGATRLGIPVPEPYTLQAECVIRGTSIVLPHTLVFTLPDE